MDIRATIKDDVIDFINRKGIDSPAIITGFNRFGCCAVSVNAQVIEEKKLKNTEKKDLIKINDKIPVYVQKYLAKKFKSLTFKLFKTGSSTTIVVEEE